MLSSLPFLKLHGKHKKLFPWFLNIFILLKERLHDFLLYEEKREV